jgi:hypothetical protein
MQASLASILPPEPKILSDSKDSLGSNVQVSLEYTQAAGVYRIHTSILNNHSIIGRNFAQKSGTYAKFYYFERTQ